MVYAKIFQHFMGKEMKKTKRVSPHEKCGCHISWLILYQMRTNFNHGPYLFKKNMRYFATMATVWTMSLYLLWWI